MDSLSAEVQSEGISTRKKFFALLSIFYDGRSLGQQELLELLRSMAATMHFKIRADDGIWHRFMLSLGDVNLLDSIRKVVEEVTGMDEPTLLWRNRFGSHPINNKADLDGAIEYVAELAILVGDSVPCVELDAAAASAAAQPAAPAAPVAAAAGFDFAAAAEGVDPAAFNRAAAAAFFAADKLEKPAVPPGFDYAAAEAYYSGEVHPYDGPAAAHLSISPVAPTGRTRGELRDRLRTPLFYLAEGLGLNKKKGEWMHFTFQYDNGWHRFVILDDKSLDRLAEMKKGVTNVTKSEHQRLYWKDAQSHNHLIVTAADLAAAADYAVKEAEKTGAIPCVVLEVEIVWPGYSFVHFKIKYNAIWHRFVIQRGRLFLDLFDKLAQITGTHKQKVYWTASDGTVYDMYNPWVIDSAESRADDHARETGGVPTIYVTVEPAAAADDSLLQEQWSWLQRQQLQMQQWLQMPPAEAAALVLQQQQLQPSQHLLQAIQQLPRPLEQPVDAAAAEERWQQWLRDERTWEDEDDVKSEYCWDEEKLDEAERQHQKHLQQMQFFRQQQLQQQQAAQYLKELQQRALMHKSHQDADDTASEYCWDKEDEESVYHWDEEKEEEKDEDKESVYAWDSTEDKVSTASVVVCNQALIDDACKEVDETKSVYCFDKEEDKESVYMWNEDKVLPNKNEDLVDEDVEDKESVYAWDEEEKEENSTKIDEDETASEYCWDKEEEVHVTEFDQALIEDACKDVEDKESVYCWDEEDEEEDEAMVLRNTEEFVEEYKEDKDSVYAWDEEKEAEEQSVVTARSLEDDTIWSEDEEEDSFKDDREDKESVYLDEDTYKNANETVNLDSDSEYEDIENY